MTHIDHDKENDMDVPILLGEGKTDTESFEGTPESGYDIAPAADPDAPEANCLTAFVVIVGLDGTTAGNSDLGVVAELVPTREADLSDMRRHASEIVHDINSMHAAQQTLALMQSHAVQAAEATQQQRLMSKLQQKGMRTK